MLRGYAEALHKSRWAASCQCGLCSFSPQAQDICASLTAVPAHFPLLARLVCIISLKGSQHAFSKRPAKIEITAIPSCKLGSRVYPGGPEDVAWRTICSRHMRLLIQSWCYKTCCRGSNGPLILTVHLCTQMQAGHLQPLGHPWLFPKVSGLLPSARHVRTALSDTSNVAPSRLSTRLRCSSFGDTQGHQGLHQNSNPSCHFCCPVLGERPGCKGCAAASGCMPWMLMGIP